MPIANGKNSVTRTGDGAGGSPAARSRKASTVGEAATAGPVRGSAGRTPAIRPVRTRTPAIGPVRGYTKLSDATKAFGFDFCGKTVLDIGSSTGGFTKYALDHGAKKVIAVEKGTNQMMPLLRNDPRIDLHEKTDIFDFKPSNEINVIVADVSFLSLKPVLSHVRIPGADYLVMLKPQFEANSSDLVNGIVKNNRIRRDIIKNFESWLKANHYVVIKKHDNELKGKNGNIERFYWLKTSTKTLANKNV